MDDLFADQVPLLLAPCPKCGSRKVEPFHDDEDCVKEAVWRDFCRLSRDRCFAKWDAELRRGAAPSG